MGVSRSSKSGGFWKDLKDLATGRSATTAKKRAGTYVRKGGKMVKSTYKAKGPKGTPGTAQGQIDRRKTYNPWKEKD